MGKNKDYAKILTDDRVQLGPYPMERLKRVDRPTTRITEDVKRVESGMGIFSRHSGAKGHGPGMSQHPLDVSTMRMLQYMPPADNDAASGMAAMRGRPGGHVPPVGGDQSTEQSSGKGDAMMEMMAAMAEIMGGGVATVKAPVTEDPKILSRHMKSLGYYLRADVVGICRLPPWAVYTHDMFGNPIECTHRNAICIVVDQGYETMRASTGDDYVSGLQSHRSYSILGFIASIMAHYIKKLGYAARANHAMSYQVVVPPLLLLAGIGELSRARIVLNPFLGLRYKAAVVTTDMPLEPDKPVDFGLQRFCDTCKKCARECPSRAISPGGRITYNGYETWGFNAESCAKYRMNNPNGLMCGRCIKVCPWNKPKGWTHDAVRWMVEHAPLFDKLIVAMDDAAGYGRAEADYKWWFDLKYDGNELKTGRK
jgi:3-chloro-4-hydroxyphenylacetate reductive dehalogenase